MKKFQQKRKGWYKCLKSLTKGRYKNPKFVFLGDEVKSGSIILSNHEGTDAPMSLELYANFPVRFWGTAEMNSGLKKMYKYQSEVYYHQKKHWNLFGARMFCLIASPLTNLFYKGLNLISTYSDRRFMQTLDESIKTIDEGDNIVIFPEKSESGYEAELSGFYSGFVMLCDKLLKQGKDVDVFVSYYNKDKQVYLFDKPIKYSELMATYGDKKLIAEALVQKCNALGKSSGEVLEDREQLAV